jgi:AraC-like DNA-binding protein
VEVDDSVPVGARRMVDMDVTATQSEWRFSTDDVPPSQRLSYLRDVLGRSIARLDLDPIEGFPLRYAGRIHLFDGLAVIVGESSGVHAVRSHSLLSDGDDDLLFHVNRSGSSVMSQVGRECRVEPGSTALMITGEPGRHVIREAVSWLTLRIPRARLCGLVGTTEDALVRPMPATGELVGLLLDYVRTALGSCRLTSPELRHLFATHVHDLVALAIGATRDAADEASGRGLRAARLNAAKEEIMRRLAENDFAVSDVARRLGLTSRYVQKLFESEGTTFTEYLVKQRLARAHRMLSDRRFLGRSITSIAFDAGFGNLSHFNRMFRRTYGATPSDVRSAARASESAIAFGQFSN